MKETLLVLLLCLTSCLNGDITEQDIKSLVNEITEASNSKNIESLERLLSQSFRVIISKRETEGNKGIELNRVQYLASIADFFNQTDRYEFKLKIEYFKISEDKQSAIVMLKVTQYALANGTEYSESAHERYFLSLHPENRIKLDCVEVVRKVGSNKSMEEQPIQPPRD